MNSDFRFDDSCEPSLHRDLNIADDRAQYLLSIAEKHFNNSVKQDECSAGVLFRDILEQMDGLLENEKAYVIVILVQADIKMAFRACIERNRPDVFAHLLDLS